MQMSKVTHLVVTYDHTTKLFSYDDDGTDVWIRDLFLPISCTWSDEDEDYIADDVWFARAKKALAKLIEGKN
jgi:hypothetical protein